MKKQAVLFANGEVTKRETAIAGQSGFDIVVAADGGIAHAKRFGYTPDAVVGDFDSLPEGIHRLFPRTRFIRRPSQEQCDLEKALIFCEEEGISTVILLGATGKRPDHTLGNLSVLLRHDRKLSLRILTPESEIFIVRKTLELKGIPGQAVSLVPMGEAIQVSTTGLKYPLNSETLRFGEREGTSNEFSSSRCSISLSGGVLFVFRLYPEY
ncbi:MAG: thiamine diphosphokinase [Acidobacteria bacterium]|nr:thiamine diphosphokinase [Acidobacteriota bacterium]